MEAEGKFSEEAVEDWKILELNTDSSTDKIENLVKIIRLLNDSLVNKEHNRLKTISNEGIHDPLSKELIVDASKLLTSMHDEFTCTYRHEGRYDKHLEISRKYKGNHELVEDFYNWSYSRKKLIEITKLAADDLDQYFFIVNIAGIIGSIAEVLLSLNLCMNRSVSSYVYNISPTLGFVMDSILEFVRHLGFTTSFFEIMQSQVIIRRVENAVKNDKHMFSPLKEWLDETRELNDLVMKIFPYEINKQIILNIENCFEDLGKEEKIFSAIVLSNLMENPMIHKNGNFMFEAFLFCKSKTAKEWYKRFICFHDNMYFCNQEYEINYLIHEMVQKVATFPDWATKLVLGKYIVLQSEYTITRNLSSIFGRLVICCMSGMSIYFCYENSRTRLKHRYSDKLRKLSTNAQSFLNTMEKILHSIIDR